MQVCGRTVTKHASIFGILVTLFIISIIYYTQTTRIVKKIPIGHGTGVHIRDKVSWSHALPSALKDDEQAPTRKLNKPSQHTHFNDKYQIAERLAALNKAVHIEEAGLVKDEYNAGSEIDEEVHAGPNPSLAPLILEPADPMDPGYPFNYSYLYRSAASFHWFKTEAGTFQERIQQYNCNISRYRKQLLQERGYKKWRNIAANITTLWCNRDDFMDVLAVEYPFVHTLLLEWWNDTSTNQSTAQNETNGDQLSIQLISQRNNNNLHPNTWSSLSDTSNVLVQSYYDWVGSPTLCDYIRTQGFTKASYDANYNRTCNTNSTALHTPSTLPIVYLYGKPMNPRDYWPNKGKLYPEYFFWKIPDFVFYIHIIEDCIITDFGDVISRNLKLAPYACSKDLDPYPPKAFNTNYTGIFSEVFVVTQYWGNEYFHKNVENMPRLAPYFEFLQNNTEINIHVKETGGYTKETFEFLGINSERFVTGVVRSKITYIPQATPCGYAYPPTTQLFSKLLRDRLHEKYSKQEQNSIVLIQRSGTRRFQDNGGMARTVKTVAEEFGLNFELFKDNPSPTFIETMKMFNRAYMIVAPHGGGLSNIIYCEPGTFVIEGVCNPPHVNLCFQWLSVVLGHRYHGIVSRGGCENQIEVNPTVVELTMRTYLNNM